MPITVAMIEEKEFKTKMRGYDPVEVDEFLDEICDEMVAMQEEIATLNQRLSQASRGGAYPQVPAPAMAQTQIPAQIPAPIAAPAPVKAVEKEAADEEKESEISEAAQKLLARAQKVYDETIAEAKEEADEIIKSARTEAANSIEAMEDKRAELEKEVETLKAAAQDYRDRFLRLIEDQQHILKAETELFA